MVMPMATGTTPLRPRVAAGMTIPLRILAACAVSVGLIFGPTGLFEHHLEHTAQLRAGRASRRSRTGPTTLTAIVGTLAGLSGIWPWLRPLFQAEPRARPPGEAAPVRSTGPRSTSSMSMSSTKADRLADPVPGRLRRSFLDKNLIDGIVQGVSWIPRLVGRYLLGPIQNGLIQYYAAVTALSVGALLLACCSSSEAGGSREGARHSSSAEDPSMAFLAGVDGPAAARRERGLVRDAPACRVEVGAVARARLHAGDARPLAAPPAGVPAGGDAPAVRLRGRGRQGSAWAWMPRFGVRFALGLDGISLWLFLLTSLLMITAVFSSWESVEERGPAITPCLLALQTGLARAVRQPRRRPVLHLLRVHPDPALLPDRASTAAPSGGGPR